MPAGQLILSYKGPQDELLTKKTKKTLFKADYSQYSDFAIERKIYDFNSLEWGTKSTCKINKDLDLIQRICLHIKLPSLNQNNDKINVVCTKSINNECFCDKCCTKKSGTIFGWVNSLAHVLVKEYSLNIGGNFRDTRTGEWLEIRSEYSQTSEKKVAYYEMIGKRDPVTFKSSTFSDEMEILLPLELFCTKSSGVAFPSCAIDDDIQLEINWNKFDECWITNKDDTRPPKVKFQASVIVEGYCLTKNEREKFECHDHSYLIEMVQASSNFYYTRKTSSPTVDMHFNLATKEFYFIVQRNDILKKSKDGESDFTFGNDHFNYSCFKSRIKNKIIDPVTSCHLRYSGTVDTDKLPGIYHRLLTPFEKHTKVPSNYIYNYTMSINPESYDPMGTINLSEVPTLRLALEINPEMNKTDYNIRIYALSYNTLFIVNRKVVLGFSV